MNKLRSLVFVAAIAAIGFAAVSCKENDRADAVTKASEANDATQLPPVGETYEVIGFVTGLNGYVIKYDDVFYRGGDIASDEGAKVLKEKGIKTIVSVTPTDLERLLAKKYGMELVEVLFEKTGVPAEALESYVKKIKAGEGPFYVHCHGGSHRAGTLAAAYRIHKQGWEFDKAIIEFGRLGGSLKDDHALLESIRIQ